MTTETNPTNDTGTAEEQAEVKAGGTTEAPTGTDSTEAEQPDTAVHRDPDLPQAGQDEAGQPAGDGAAPADDTTDGQDAEDSPADVVSGEAGARKLKAAAAEAARYRHRLRDTEAERDEARAEVDRLTAELNSTRLEFTIARLREIEKIDLPDVAWEQVAKETTPEAAEARARELNAQLRDWARSNPQHPLVPGGVRSGGEGAGAYGHAGHTPADIISGAGKEYLR